MLVVDPPIVQAARRFLGRTRTLLGFLAEAQFAAEQLETAADDLVTRMTDAEDQRTRGQTDAGQTSEDE
jgi:hypothetical protein